MEKKYWKLCWNIVNNTHTHKPTKISKHTFLFIYKYIWEQKENSTKERKKYKTKFLYKKYMCTWFLFTWEAICGNRSGQKQNYNFVEIAQRKQLKFIKVKSKKKILVKRLESVPDHREIAEDCKEFSKSSYREHIKVRLSSCGSLLSGSCSSRVSLVSAYQPPVLTRSQHSSGPC